MDANIKYRLLTEEESREFDEKVTKLSDFCIRELWDRWSLVYHAKFFEFLDELK